MRWTRKTIVSLAASFAAALAVGGIASASNGANSGKQQPSTSTTVSNRGKGPNSGTGHVTSTTKAGGTASTVPHGHGGEAEPGDNRGGHGTTPTSAKSTSTPGVTVTTVKHGNGNETEVENENETEVENENETEVENENETEVENEHGTEVENENENEVGHGGQNRGPGGGGSDSGGHHGGN